MSCAACGVGVTFARTVRRRSFGRDCISDTSIARTRRCTVHSRANEKYGCTTLVSRVKGPSPRPWGTLARRELSGLQSRFIPTPVGNTTVTITRLSAATVHPRARGEHTNSAVAMIISCGSSPRPRETRRQSACCSDHRTVHLHPRAWGIPPQLDQLAGQRRFIPTRGKHWTRIVSTQSRASVHSHARGKHSPPLYRYEDDYGSSPRTWGTHFPQHIVLIQENDRRGSQQI